MSEALQLLRHLPAVETVRRQPPLADLPDGIAVLLAREAIASVRAQVVDGTLLGQDAIPSAVAHAVQQRSQRLTQPSLRRIINGSGVLLHTNAGRAPLAAGAIAAITDTARGYCNLELSLDDGRRSSRQDHVRQLLCWLTGAEDALVVNNGAAAVLLALHALAAGRQVVVSRGELVEIGGGFRIPEVMTAAGAALVEVGTTNRTHLRDYAKALDRDKNHQIAALLQVHRSNFALVGFTKTPELAELAALAHARDTPLVVDVGSGALGGLTTHVHGAFEREPLVADVLRQGADLALFSGDKLVSGPQAGILVGKRAFVQAAAQNPMARALRVDNLTLAALEHVLRTHLLGRASAELPVLAAVALTPVAVTQLADAIAAHLRAHLPADWRVTVASSEAQLGGGTDPLVRLPSACVVLQRLHVAGPELQVQLLAAVVPIIGRVRGDGLWLDARTLAAGMHGASAEVLADELLASLRGP
jgi:L-seryl-tRNA(Ser) seleniumtransferase